MGVRSEKNELNGNGIFKNELKFAQYYQIARNSKNPIGAVGRPLVHKSALQQTTGYSIY